MLGGNTILIHKSSNLTVLSMSCPLWLVNCSHKSYNYSHLSKKNIYINLCQFYLPLHDWFPWRGQIAPPPLIVIKIYNIWYIFKKKKNGKFANIQISKFLLQYLVIKQKLCSKTAQISTNYNYWKAFDPENLNLEKHLKNFEIYTRVES